MYVKVSNGVIEKYPYSINQLRQDNAQVSFPNEIPSSLLNEYGVFAVEQADVPTVELNQNVAEGLPQLVNGTWKQNWVITNATYEAHLAKVLNARKKEYPPMANYLDAVVKNDTAQIQKYIDDCKAVKVKYPKP
jgi:hypothetical protein